MQAAKALLEDPRWVRLVQCLVDEAAILNEDVERTVYQAFASMPRISFLEGCSEQPALDDVDLPLPHGEVLTRPSIQIRMMALINLRKRMRVLELGFGSGYLCAVMAAAGAQVFGLEQNTSVAQASRKQLDTLGLHGIVVRRGDGRKGWEEVSPFDAIVGSYPVANESELPLAQLALGGSLVAPILWDGAVRLAVWTRTGEETKRVLFEKVDFR